MFEVEYSNQAANFIRKADKILAGRLLRKIEELRTSPVPHDAKTIHGFSENLFRTRVGDYRILYELSHKNNKIGIVKIDHREKVYD